jgi:hypothetical protein
MYHDFMILGGAGLVGAQVVRHIVAALKPRRVVIASLKESEAVEAAERHEREFGESVSFVPAFGNLFVPTELAELDRAEMMRDPARRRELMEAVYGRFDDAYRNNHLVRLVRQHRPEVIVDAVNTATGLSYQDVFDGAAKVRGWIEGGRFDPEGTADLETFLLSQSVPQLIRHVRFVHRATQDYGTQVYLKVGTTGTGGMGFNIPYTHSEDRPSKKLLAKTEAAFGHTGLLFLMARTPDGPIVKEVKPAAMIGYRAVKVRTVSDKHGNEHLFEPKELSLTVGGQLVLGEPEDGYEKVGKLDIPVLDTGENGVFTRGEFAAITALGQMEYITPEEIARTVVLELRGANTGQDVISALDGAVLNPSYKAGLVRGVALRDLDQAEKEVTDAGGIPSIALGRLGPPELSKLLFEAALLKAVYDSRIEGILEDEREPEAVAEDLVRALELSRVGRAAPSIGIPVLLPDGLTLLRGPRINVPELSGHQRSAALEASGVDAWARKGWIDLRAKNVTVWRKRIRAMVQARLDLKESGSAAASIHAFMSDRFELGELVAWIFNNEMKGHRIK